MRIGILTQYYPPETGAPQRRLSFLARSMAERGHEVYVLTAMPNYPIGRVFDGYGGFWMKEVKGCETILRSAIYPTQKVALLPRLANYFSFAVSALITGLLRLPKLDYLMTESPPLFLGPTGWLLAKAKGARPVFNVSDLWPDSAVELGVVSDGLSLDIARRLERWCYWSSWLITGQSHGILASIESRFPGVQTWRLSNGVDTSAFSPERADGAVRRELAGDAACLAVYAGLHGIAQGLDQILDAAHRLPQDLPLRIVLIGDGAEKQKLIEMAARRNQTNVRFMDPMPAERIPAVMASADIALVPLKHQLTGAVPSKLYEAMGSGLPVVLVAEGEAAAIVQQSGAGFSIAPGDIGGLANALEALAKDGDLRRAMGERGRRTALDQFDRGAISERFIRLLEDRLRRPSRRAYWLQRLLAALALAASSPLLLLLAAAVALESGFPIFFRQTRVGRDGRPFQLLKFRSMRSSPGGSQITQAGDSRVTRIGTLLRKYKLDELPQFWNVVRGDMALIGPRPEVPRFVDLEDPAWREVLSVRPGITDLATLVYRNEEEILKDAEDVERTYREKILPEKLALNIRYLRGATAGSDLRLLMLTAYYSFLPGRFNPARLVDDLLGPRAA